MAGSDKASWLAHRCDGSVAACTAGFQGAGDGVQPSSFSARPSRREPFGPELTAAERLIIIWVLVYAGDRSSWVYIPQ